MRQLHMTVRTRHGSRCLTAPLCSIFATPQQRRCCSFHLCHEVFWFCCCFILFFCFWLLWPRQSSRHWQSFGKRGAFLNGHVLQFKRRQQAGRKAGSEYIKARRKRRESVNRRRVGVAATKLHVVWKNEFAAGTQQKIKNKKEENTVKTWQSL